MAAQPSAGVGVAALLHSWFGYGFAGSVGDAGLDGSQQQHLAVRSVAASGASYATSERLFPAVWRFTNAPGTTAWNAFTHVDGGFLLFLLGILIGLIFAAWTNPGDISFQSFLTDLTFRVRLKAMHDDLGFQASGELHDDEEEEAPVSRNGAVSGSSSSVKMLGVTAGKKRDHLGVAGAASPSTITGRAATKGQSTSLPLAASSLSASAAGKRDDPAASMDMGPSPHVLSFANHLSISVQTPPYKRYDYGIFSLVSVQRRCATVTAVDMAASGGGRSASVPTAAGKHGAATGASSVGVGMGSGRMEDDFSSAGGAGGRRRGKALKRQQATKEVAGSVKRPCPAGSATDFSGYGKASTTRPDADGSIQHTTPVMGMLSAVEEKHYWFLGIFGQWFVGSPGWSNTFLEDTRGLADPWYHPPLSHQKRTSDEGWGIINMSNDFSDNHDYTDGTLRALEAGDVLEDEDVSRESRSHRLLPDGRENTEHVHAPSPSDETLLPPAIAPSSNKARKRKGPPGRQKAGGAAGGSSPQQSPAALSSSGNPQDSGAQAENATGPASPNVRNHHRKLVAPSSGASLETASARIHEGDHAQRSSEQADLESLIAAVASSRAAVGDLEGQFEALQASNNATKTSLQQQLEELRAKKKEEDSVRSDLRSKMKGLDESKRVAELHRKDAERKLKAALTAREGHQTRIEKQLNEIKALKQTAEMCKEKLEGSQQERLDKEVQLENDRAVKEADLKRIVARAADLRQREGDVRKQLLAAKSGLEEARVRLQQRQAAAFEAVLRQASETVMQQQHRSVSNSAMTVLENDITASEALFDPTAKLAAPPTIYPSLAGPGDLSLTEPDLSGLPERRGLYSVNDAMSAPRLVAPMPLQRFGFDARTNDDDHADNEFHDAEEGQEPEVPTSFVNGRFARMTQTEALFYENDPSTMMPATPISPFSTGLLPSNLFQNLDEDAQGNLVSPSHVNSMFARFGIPAQSDGISANSEGRTHMSMDPAEITSGRSETSDAAQLESASEAEMGEGDKPMRKSMSSRRSWWGKRASKDTSAEASASPAPDAGARSSETGEENTSDADVGKRRSYGMFPRISMNPSAKSFPGSAQPGSKADQNAARQVPSISRPIGPLIPLNNTVNGTLSSDYEAVRRAFQLPLGAEDEESGRNSWSAFDTWQANEGARRAMLQAALTQQNSGAPITYDPRFSSDSLPLALHQRVDRWQGSSGNLPLDRTTSAELSTSDASSGVSRGRSVSSRLAFWASNSENMKSVSPARTPNLDTGTDAEASSELSSSPNMARTPGSRRKFWSRKAEAEPEPM
ncbi:hypothetical protein K437DRAFT_170287 [Tilletiaria anomala UBC 951]|uniref:Uncharacterized protein n=1 Tax=Tilletiaria anomala (strain ATCC 24038 / CBS 436.72 / UBC 951) TaxID=1037660 RepID=A0A066VJ71_TILAU|nr:uncharacterized protein K437DRAFT_170287 [Tilletiaria anomala UBC 951]KDN41777.1 hypothetical protein K437DRAFT_170287 [Tilletiaria anomala UBC 951]